MFENMDFLNDKLPSTVPECVAFHSKRSNLVPKLRMSILIKSENRYSNGSIEPRWTIFRPLRPELFAFKVGGRKKLVIKKTTF